MMLVKLHWNFDVWSKRIQRTINKFGVALLCNWNVYQNNVNN